LLIRLVIVTNFCKFLVLERKAPEDFLRDFGLVNKYQEYFSIDEEKRLIDKEFINKNSFEDVAADDDDELLKEETK
jgi:hypothetical protein